MAPEIEKLLNDQRIVSGGLIDGGDKAGVGSGGESRRALWIGGADSIWSGFAFVRGGAVAGEGRGFGARHGDRARRQGRQRLSSFPTTTRSSEGRSSAPLDGKALARHGGG